MLQDSIQEFVHFAYILGGKFDIIEERIGFVSKRKVNFDIISWDLEVLVGVVRLIDALHP